MIDDRIFVAIVVMALATSLLAGPVMNYLLDLRGNQAKAAPKSMSRSEPKAKAA